MRVLMVADEASLGSLRIFPGNSQFRPQEYGRNGLTMLACYGSIRISSGALYAEKNVVPYNTYLNDWTAFSIPLTAADWGCDNHPMGLHTCGRDGIHNIHGCANGLLRPYRVGQFLLYFAGSLRTGRPLQTAAHARRMQTRTLPLILDRHSMLPKERGL